MPRLFRDICSKFSDELLQKCHSKKIYTVADFVTHDPEELAKSFVLPYKDILLIHRTLIINYAAPAQNGRSLYLETLQSISILNTGSKRLNYFLCGGVYSGEITEIYGQPGSGKTQFCLSLISNLVVEGKNTALYVDTCGNFTAKRLDQILKSKCHDNQVAKNKLQSIQIKSIYNIYELFDCLDQIKCELEKLDKLFFKYLKVLVIDSITCLISPCFSVKYFNGIGMIHNISQILRTMCYEFKLCVLIVNNTVSSNTSNVKPALGQTWKTVPSVTLQVEKVMGSQYKMKTIKSPRNGTLKEVKFNINESGISD